MKSVLNSFVICLCRYGLMLTFIGCVIVIFVITNIWCALLIHDCMSSCCSARSILITRVAINDSLFIIMGAILSVFIYRVSQVSAVSVILEAKVSYEISCFVTRWLCLLADITIDCLWAGIIGNKRNKIKLVILFPWISSYIELCIAKVVQYWSSLVLRWNGVDYCIRITE